MRLMKLLTFLPAFLFMITYAKGQEVHYNYDRGVNFSSYKTYQWIDLADGRVPDQLIDRDIKRAVDEQLTQKGLTRVEKDADIYVSYQAVITLEKSLNLSGSGGDIGGWDPWGGGWRTGSVQGQTSTIPVGMLVVSLYDPGRKQLIWRGDASKTIDLKKDPDKNYKNLRKAMTKLFKNYPPRPGK